MIKANGKTSARGKRATRVKVRAKRKQSFLRGLFTIFAGGIK